MSAKWWRPDRFALRRENLRKRTAIVTALRDWFAREGFAEVETPALQPAPPPEPQIAPFVTQLRGPGDGEGVTRFLHSSPELAMKKLLVAGETRIWQLARVFRNAERAATHHPEFTMLEWYRAGAGYQTLMDDCAAILHCAARAAGAARLTWQGCDADPSAPCERLSVAEAFARHAGIDVLATAPDPADPSLALLAAAARPLGLAPRAGDRWDDLYFRVFLERIEPKLGLGRPTLLYDYPVSMAALARVKPSDPRVAERVELYVCGLELANGFGELSDAGEQRRRLERDAAIRRARGEAAPIDRDFIAALEHGMPEAAGMALGFDRLVMLATGAARIEDVLWAPVEDDRD
jgi:elongation factor P--(R)-beta-lysine ligase